MTKPEDRMLKTTVDVKKDGERMSSDCDRIRHRLHVTAFPRICIGARSRRVLNARQSSQQLPPVLQEVI